MAVSNANLCLEICVCDNDIMNKSGMFGTVVYYVTSQSFLLLFTGKKQATKDVPWTNSLLLHKYWQNNTQSLQMEVLAQFLSYLGQLAPSHSVIFFVSVKCIRVKHEDIIYTNRI